MPSERVQRQIDRLLDEAEEAMAKMAWDVVYLRSQAVFTLDPNNNDAQTYIEAARRGLAEEESPRTEEPSPRDAPGSDTTHPEAQPTSFADGRYMVKEFLGEGARKKVYLVHDTLLDRDVAFAVIKTEGLDDTGRQRILREAQTMGRLGDHPNIVQLHDLGDESGQPYMVMPVMSGGDVDGLMREAPDRRLPLEKAIGVAKDVCRGLDFAHASGVVHRDLKPGNVWLTAGGTARIGDFGLAVTSDRSRLTAEGMMMGTALYIPPEQAMGREVDERSDLYSLGAMLYEMVTGRPPFLGDDPVAVIGQHVNTPPVAPSWHNAQCPRPLEALILRLLAKDPAERPTSAADVLTALDGVDLGAVEERTEEEARSLDSLAGSVFVGRQREMGELKAALEDALSGHGRLVMLVGEPGIGKTRTTATELATSAGLRGAQALWGRCYEERGMPPYWPWIQAIRSYVYQRDPERLRSEMGAGAADIAEIVSEVREQLPDLEPPPALESPEAARFRLFDSITSFLKRASQSQPLVVALDDLHWADEASLGLLQFVARELGDSRLLVSGSYRDIELSRQHPLAETLGELNKERLFQRVPLRGLSEEDVGRFIEVAAGIMRPRRLVEAVHSQTEGNPLYVTEVVRLLVQEGDLAPDVLADRESWDVRIPEGVHEVIGRRLNRLSARCNETMRIAAVLGREFELAHLRPVMDETTESQLLDLVEEALGARLIIEELPRTVGRYRFTHALIRHTLTDELTTTRRVRLHARIAQALEELYGKDAEAHAVELAYHYGEAEAVVGTERLVHYSRIAGGLALDSYAYEDAVSHFERALGAREGGSGGLLDEDTAAISVGLGYAHIALFNVDKALSQLRSAFDYYVETGNIPKAVEIAEYGHSNEIIEGMRAVMPRALAMVDPDSHEAGRILANHGYALGLVEDGHRAAMEAFDQALAVSRRENDKLLEVRTLANVANIHGLHMFWADSLEASRRAIDLSVAVDDPRSKLRCLSWASGALLELAEPDEASQRIEEMAELAERLHDHVWQERAARPMLNLALLTGEWQTADRAVSRQSDTVEAPPQRLLIESHQGIEHSGTENLILSEHVEGLRSSVVIRGLGIAAAALSIAARIEGSAELLDLAETYATAASTSALDMFPVSSLYIQHCLSIVAAEHQDVAVAEGLYDAMVSRPRVLSSAISSHRVLGLLAHTLGRLDTSATHFEDAIEICRKAGYLVELAWSLCDYADTLRQRDAEGDRHKAQSLLDESLKISRDLGMRPLMERVLSRREILGA